MIRESGRRRERIPRAAMPAATFQDALVQSIRRMHL
jgi:hypothetical protein